MSSQELLEAELALKVQLLSSLTTENEELRAIVQSNSNAAHNAAADTSALQAQLSTLQSQISSLPTLISQLKIKEEENVSLYCQIAEISKEKERLQRKLRSAETSLLEESKKYEDERAAVINLRAGLEESKKAIAILNQQERRGSAAAIARRASLDKAAHLVAVAGESTASPHRRGSLNYLSGLGLTSKRVSHFDPQRNGSQSSTASFNPRSTVPASAGPPLDSEIANEADGRGRRASLPSAGTSPSVFMQAFADGLAGQAESFDDNAMPNFGTTLRRASATASRRSSNVIDPGMRRPSLARDANDAPMEASSETDKPAETPSSPLLQVAASPRRRRSLADFENQGASVRRRSSANLHGLAVANLAQRRGSEQRPLRLIAESPLQISSLAGQPTPVDEAAEDLFEQGLKDAPSPASSVRRHSNVRSYAREADNEVIQALSVEAAMEISSLKDMINELRMQLMESEEGREASENISRALRGFIAASATTQVEHVNLPPPPSDDTADLEAKQVAQAKPKLEKRTSRLFGLLPTINVPALASGSRRDASASISNHLPPIVPEKNRLSMSTSSIPTSSPTQLAPADRGSTNFSPLLTQPAWRTNGKLRNLSVASGMSDTTASARPSPILSPGVPGFSSVAFGGFSFSAHAERSDEEMEVPPSPGGSRHSNSPPESFTMRMERLSSVESAMDEASEASTSSMPPTPHDDVFPAEIQTQRKELDSMAIMNTPRITYTGA